MRDSFKEADFVTPRMTIKCAHQKCMYRVSQDNKTYTEAVITGVL